MRPPLRACAAALLLSATACFPPGEGRDPPLNRVYFPVGLALDADAERLFVVSSDFDLQYNGGVVQSLDLDRLADFVPSACQTDDDCGVTQRCDTEPTDANGGVASGWCVDRGGPHAGAPCGVLGERSAADRWLEPGRCEYVDPVSPQDDGAPLLVDAVGIGAFATDVVFRRAPEGAANGELAGRLFVPVRGDATLHVIDVRAGDDTLDCGQDRNGGSCSDEYRAGDDPDAENTRDLRMPPEPFAIDATEDGAAVAVTHQTDGSVSLFLNDWAGRARLEFVANGMPQRVVGIAAIPTPGVVAAAGYDYRPGFLVTFRDSAEVRLLRYFDDIDPTAPSNVQRPYLDQSGGVVLTANSAGYDSRGIAIDATARRACEASCSGDDVACLGECAAIPLGVYVSNRTPNSLLVGATRADSTPTSSDDLPTFYDSIPVPVGASRVVVGQVVDEQGQLVPRIFVLCFDQRRLVIYDPVGRRIERTTVTGRGPHAFVVDARASAGTAADARSLGYLAHFTDSYLGVVDLDQRHHSTYGEIVLTVGAPVPPRASK